MVVQTNALLKNLQLTQESDIREIESIIDNQIKITNSDNNRIVFILTGHSVKIIKRIGSLRFSSFIMDYAKRGNWKNINYNESYKKSDYQSNTNHNMICYPQKSFLPKTEIEKAISLLNVGDCYYHFCFILH